MQGAGVVPKQASQVEEEGAAEEDGAVLWTWYVFVNQSYRNRVDALSSFFPPTFIH